MHLVQTANFEFVDEFDGIIQNRLKLSFHCLLCVLQHTVKLRKLWHRILEQRMHLLIWELYIRKFRINCVFTCCGVWENGTINLVFHGYKIIIDLIKICLCCHRIKLDERCAKLFELSSKGSRSLCDICGYALIILIDFCGCYNNDYDIKTHCLHYH